MTTVGHVTSSDGAGDTRIGLSTLLSRISSARRRQCVAAAGRAETVALPSGTDVHPIGSGLSETWSVGSAVRLARWARRIDVHILHAWTARAVCLAGTVRPEGVPLVFSCSDPGLDARTVRALRVFAERGALAVVCAAQQVRRRLVEQGVPADRCVVIRPPVDFARINEIRASSSLRSRIGATDKDRVVLVPVTRDVNAAVEGAWAMMVQGLLDERLRIVVLTGEGNDAALRRLAAASYRPGGVTVLDRATPFEESLGVADALLLCDDGDVSTVPVAWAMAAGVLVVAAAGYAVSELISHKLNGLLYKRRSEAGVIVAIAQCFAEASTPLGAKLRDAARGQAYEAFGVRRFVDQHLRLYDNLTSGRSVDDGIVDSALVA
ncbi:MAG: glycosyltransferase [Phycisphaerae bacterium]|nr:MAG: hypothetical protein EDS66_01200 [Planctomycetota bacterium]KAB2947229.1 MAG: glycosyltransferase [Phycisphaerae bacterium]MBE7458075.1 glycosyltransferase [Planctomycetia bacterium]MCK6464460.1 glycosyltransferase [Phycisphaerae bacterium]MCL4717989.1 glycosyltransferase [Phycisphaerae bacterium]